MVQTAGYVYDGGSVRDDNLTHGSGALGTPNYMPPEQISKRNGELGPWSDVYGLGATLYHLLAGRAPFSGSVRVEGQRIEDVVAGATPPPNGATVIDGGGATLMPGLVESHAHIGLADMTSHELTRLLREGLEGEGIAVRAVGSR